MEQHGAGGLRLKGSCSIRAGGAGGERGCHSARRPPGCRRRSIIRQLVVRRPLVPRPPRHTHTLRLHQRRDGGRGGRGIRRTEHTGGVERPRRPHRRAACVLRRTSVPVQPVRRLLHPEGEPAAPHQAALGGETLQVSPVQLRLPPEGRPHRTPAHPLR